MLNKIVNFFNGHLTWGGPTAGSGDGLYNIGVDSRVTNNAGDGLRPRNIFAAGLIASGNLYGLNAPYGVNGPASVVGGLVAAGNGPANVVAFMGSSTLLDGVSQGFFGFSKDTGSANVPGFFNSNTLSDHDIYFGVGHRSTVTDQRLKFGADGTIGFMHQQSSTPSAPASGSDSLYFKTNDGLYTQNSAGLERLVTASNGYANLLAQTASISATTLFTPSADGLYQVSVYANVTTTDPTATMSVTITWTDDSGAQSSTVISGLAFATTAYSPATLVIKAKASTAVQYSTSLTGATGSPQYTLIMSGITLGQG